MTDASLEGPQPEEVEVPAEVPTGTQKGIIKVTQVILVDVDLSKYAHNVFVVNGKNETITSLETLAEVLRRDNAVNVSLGEVSRDVTDVTIVNPDLQKKVDALRQQAQKAMDEANKLIKG